VVIEAGSHLHAPPHPLAQSAVPSLPFSLHLKRKRYRKRKRKREKSK
jgi:hypothetical protein